MKLIKNISSYLRPTKYVDFYSPEIKKIAREISQPYTSEKEKIKALFYWVKENIKFEFGYWGIKASEMVKRKTGMCTTKSTLLIAFLRAIGIPAGYGILEVKTKEFYGELMIPSFKKLVSPQTVHIYVGVFLTSDGKWIRCDPTADSEILNRLMKTNPFAQMTGFELAENEIDNLKGIIKNSEFFPNIDKDLDKLPRHAKGINLEILNYYLKFLRTTKLALKCSSDKELENHFIVWLQKEAPHCYEFLIKILES